MSLEELPGRFAYAWPRPALSVDVAVFGVDQVRGNGNPPDAALQILLIRRGVDPFRGWWALPGGFVRVDEDLAWAARRELREEAGVEPAWIEQIGAFGAPGRDPRERVVSVAWWALVRLDGVAPAADSDAAEVAWHAVNALPELAFDHAAIVAAAVGRMRRRTWDGFLGAELVDEPFTLAELQAAEECLLGRPLDKRNFRRRALDLPALVDTGSTRAEAAHRPARLYTFDRTQSPIQEAP